MIREFDTRGGWGNGFSSCAAWLTWRVGLDPGAARERVRVARALGSLPRLAQALGRGELSYSKIRGLTRVATPETEERLLAVGRAGTAEHVERIVRGWRRVDRIPEARETTKRYRGRALHVYEDDDGMVVIHGRIRGHPPPTFPRKRPVAFPRKRTVLFHPERACSFPMTRPRGASSRPMPSPSSPKQHSTTESSQERRESAIKSWSTSMRPCSQIRTRPASPFSKAAHTFRQKRRNAWPAMRAAS